MTSSSGLETSVRIAIAGAHPAIFIRTDEPDEVTDVVKGLCADCGWEVWEWDVARGLVRESAELVPRAGINTAQPLAQAIDLLAKYKPRKGNTSPLIDAEDEDSFVDESSLGSSHAIVNEDDLGDSVTVLFVHNLHFGTMDLRNRQMVLNALRTFRTTFKCIVGYGHKASDIGPELTPQFTIIHHELPGTAEFSEILKQIVRDDQYVSYGLPMTDADKAQVCNAGLGMTRMQFDLAVHEQIAEMIGEGEARKIDPRKVWDRKCQILNTEGLVKVLSPSRGFSGLGGMDGLKSFVRGLLDPRGHGSANPVLRPSGIILVSLPGTGKTTLIEAIAHEMGYPAVMMNFDALMGGLVGDTERNTRRAFEIVDTMAPKDGNGWLIVGWDEIEKMLTQTDTGLDSGVGMRQMSSVLKWLTSRKSRTFVVATANKADGLNAALTRVGRFDAVFFVEPPERKQRDIIWSLYLDAFCDGIVPKANKPFQWPGQHNIWHRNKMFRFLGGTPTDPTRWTDKQEELSSAVVYPDYDSAMAAMRELNLDEEKYVVRPVLPDDNGWTGAEIQGCCRLARMLIQPPSVTGRQIVPVVKRETHLLTELQTWARTCSLSSETGKLYGAPEVADNHTTAAKKMRRLPSGNRPAAKPE